MKTQRALLVTTSPRGVRTRVWDTQSEAEIGYPVQYRLRRKRDHFYLSNEQGGRLAKFDHHSAQSGVRLDQTPNLKIQILPIQSAPAGFRDLNARVLSHKTQIHPKDSQVFIYASIYQWMLSADCLNQAFSGVVRGIPAFTLTQSGEGYVIRCLRPKLKLRVRGESTREGSPGTVWSIQGKDLTNTMIQLGAHSWRFNRVAPGADDPYEDRHFDLHGENQVFRTSAALSVVALLGLFSYIWTHNSSQSNESPIALPPLTRLVADQIKFIPQTLPPLKKPEVRLVEIIEKPLNQSQSPEPVDRTQPVMPSPPAPVTRRNETPVKKKNPVAAVAVSKTPQAAAMTTEPSPSPQELAAQRAAAKKAEIQSAISGLLAKSDGSAKAIKQSAQSRAVLDGKTNDSGQVNISRTGKDIELQEHSTLVGATVQAEYDKANRHVGSNGAETILSSNWVQTQGDGIAMDGGLDKDQVAKVVNTHIQEVRSCHDSATRRSGRIEGRLEISFVIDPNGAVSQAKSLSNSSGDPTLGTCIIGRLKTWSFPRPRGGVSVSVSYPFVFRTIKTGND
jgi:TonB family protein